MFTKVREYNTIFYFRNSEFTNLLKEQTGAFVNLPFRFFQPQETKETQTPWLSSWNEHVSYERKEHLKKCYNNIML